MTFKFSGSAPTPQSGRNLKSASARLRKSVRWWPLLLLLLCGLYWALFEPHLIQDKTGLDLGLKIYPLPKKICLAQPFKSCFAPGDEPELLFEQIAPFCPANNCTVLDVGANKGDFLKRGLEILPKARFLAFEPHPFLANKLTEKYQSVENVVIHNVGLSTAKGSLKATVSYLNSSASYQAVKFVEACPATLDADRSCLSIPVIPLDQVATEHVNLMKIDVQGHELDVLLGSLGLLGSYGIDIILSEVSPSLFHTAEHARTYLKLLSLMNYKIFVLKRLDPPSFKKSSIPVHVDGEPIQDHPLLTQMAQKGAWMDVLCIKKELILSMQ